MLLKHKDLKEFLRSKTSYLKKFKNFYLKIKNNTF